MFKFDFEKLDNLSILKLFGELEESDQEELDQIISYFMRSADKLEIDLGSVTLITAVCRDLINKKIAEMMETNRELILSNEAGK